MKRFKFTQSKLTALPTNPKDAKSTEAEYSDEVVIGLKLLVGKNGNKKFLYRYSYKGKKRSIAIGSFGAFTVDQARVAANKHKATVAAGEDPKQMRNDKLTFADFALNQYLPHAKVNKRSFASDASKLRIYLIPAFGDRDLTAITTQFYTTVSE